MNYATIKNCDIANGPGVRVSLFVSGCTHRCPGCFNSEAWDFDFGQPFDQAVIDRILDQSEPYWGYDARAKKYCDLVAAGIIDPTGVVCTALTNAVSASSVVVTTESLVAELKPEKEQKQ